MTLKLKNNAISNFNINTDMSILSANEESLIFKDFIANFRLKLSSFFVSKLKFDSDVRAITGTNGLVEGEDLEYKIQCVFQNKDTFNRKFVNSIFDKPNNLNYYSSESNDEISFLSQKNILNKYYKTDQSAAHVNSSEIESSGEITGIIEPSIEGNQFEAPGIPGASIPGTSLDTGSLDIDTSIFNKSVVYNGFLNRFNDPQNYDINTREYTFSITSDVTKQLLQDKFTSVRIFILDKDNNIIGDTETQETNADFFSLASRVHNKNEVIFFKKEIIEKLNLILTKEGENYTFRIVNDNIFSVVPGNFNIQISGIVAFENNYNEGPRFDFSLDLDNEGNITESVINERDARIVSFERLIAKHHILSLPGNFNNDCRIGIQANINFTRIGAVIDSNDIFLDNIDSYNFNYENRNITVPNLNNLILDSYGNSEFSKIFDVAKLKPLIESDVNDDFYLTINGIQNIDQIDSVHFKNNVFLNNIRIADQEIDKLFQDAERLDLNSFTFQNEFLNDSSITLLNLRRGKRKFYFSLLDSQSLVFENENLRVQFVFKLFLHNREFEKTITLDRISKVMQGEYAERIENINATLSNKINFEFADNLSIIKNYRENNGKHVYFTPLRIYFNEADIDAIFNENFYFFGYTSSEKLEFLSNLYIYLNNNLEIITKFNFSQNFVFNSSNSTYEMNSSTLDELYFYNLDNPVAVSPGMNSDGILEELELFLRGDDLNKARDAIAYLNSKVNYEFRINSLILPKKIDALAGTGLEITEDDNIVLFPDSIGQSDYNQNVLDANNFINLITSTFSQDFRKNIFRYLFDSTFNDDTFHDFFSALFKDRLGNIKIVFSHQNNIQFSSLEEFMENDYDRVEFSGGSFETSNDLQTSFRMLGGDDLSIDFDALDLDILPEKNIYRDFYNFEKTNNEILLVNNPFKVNFDTFTSLVRLSGAQSNSVERFVTKMTIFNNVSEDSIIKLDITSIKNSFGIIGNLNSSDIFVRASIFPLFTWHRDIIYQATDTGLRRGVPEFIPYSYYYSQYRTENNLTVIIDPEYYTTDNYDSPLHRPNEQSMIMFEGKRYISYQRFYARDKFLDRNIFKFSENYIPQSQIQQTRSLNRDYIVINVNPGVGVDILRDNDFLTNESNVDDYNRASNMFTPAVRFLGRSRPMLKNLVLRLSVSLKVNAGPIPRYTTLYLNSIVQRQNHQEEKLFFLTRGIGQTDKFNQTFVDLKHISN